VGRISLAILSLAVAGVVAVGQGEALANHVSCGDTITADTTLDSDLVNCPNNGIVIGADDITLDLDGHRVDGDGQEFQSCPESEFCDVGVINDGHDGVAVKDGSVREFAVGVWVASSVGIVRHNRVLGISSSRNFFAGIGVSSAARSLVRNSSGTGSISHEDGVGIFLFGSHVRILHNSFRHNGNQGIFVSGFSTENLIKGNLLSRNRFGIELAEADRNRLRRNRIVRDGQIGIYVAPGSRNVIARNHISHTRVREGIAIEVDGGDRNVIARNSVRDTSGPAISIGFDVVVGNVVRRNRIREADKDGVNVDDKAKRTLLRRNHSFGAKDDGIVVRGKHTVLKRNVVRRAGEDGVLVKSIARRTLLRRNHSFAAKEDGIDVGSPSTKLRRNLAARNGDLGIEAVSGVTDRGRNRAHGNGDPRQCTHVVCS
jgi:parallel beta-helix repeat protein